MKLVVEEDDRIKKIVFSILFNALIAIAEFVGGVVSGSLALISDAGHNLSDVLSLVLGLVGEKISRSKPNNVYTFGLKRFEVAIALINALILIIVGGYIILEAVERLNNPYLIQADVMLFVALIGLVGNALSIFLLHHHRNESLNMKAAFLHLFFDTLSSIGVVIVAISIVLWEVMFLDLVIALAIVGMIAYSVWGIVLESWRIFMQGAPRGINVAEIQKKLEKIKGVKSVHGLHIWSVSSSEIFLSCHVCLDAAIPRLNTDVLIKQINQMLRAQYNIHHTAIQIERERICGLGRNEQECCR